MDRRSCVLYDAILSISLSCSLVPFRCQVCLCFRRGGFWVRRRNESSEAICFSGIPSGVSSAQVFFSLTVYLIYLSICLLIGLSICLLWPLLCSTRFCFTYCVVILVGRLQGTSWYDFKFWMFSVGCNLMKNWKIVNKLMSNSVLMYSILFRVIRPKIY